MTVEVDRLVVRLEAQFGQFQRELTRTQAETNAKLGAIETRFATMTSRLKASASTAALGIGGALGGIGAMLGAQQVVEYASAWKRVERSIDASGRVFGIALKPAAELNALANEARIDVEAYTKTYIRASAAIRDYGYDSDTAANLTSTLAKALKLGSASASEQASTILQFSQALQKGKLDGDEFRTVMENAGVVQELLAERLRVSKGEIINLAAAGKLKVPDLVGALVDGGARVDRIFSEMPATVDEAFSVLRNNLTQFLGDADKATGATSAMADGIVTLSRNLELMAVAAGAILGSASVRMLAFAAATVGAANPISLLGAAIGALSVGYGLFGDEVRVSGDGVVALSDSLNAFLQIAGENAGAAISDLVGWLGQLWDVADWAKTGLSELGLDQLIGKMKELSGEAQSFGYMIAKAAEKMNLLFIPEMLKVMAGITASIPAFVSGVDERARSIAADRAAPQFGGYPYLSQVQTSPTGRAAATPDRDKLSQFEREVLQIQRRTEALKAEVSVIGESTFAQEKAKAAAELRFAMEQTAAKEGRRVTDEEREAVDRLAGAYAGTRVEAEFLNRLQSERDASNAIRDELALTGLYGEELYKARIEQQLLNEAKRAGIAMTDDLRAQIADVAETRANLESLRDTLREVQSAGTEALTGFISDLREGKSASEALGNALNRIADRMINMGIEQIVTSAMGGLGTGGGTGLFGFATGGVMTPSGPRSLPRFASGGVSHSAAIFGEAGPEAAVPLPDGRSIPVDLRMPRQAAAGGGGTNMQISVAPVFNVQNGTPEGVAKLRGEIAKEMPDLIRKTVHNLMDRDARIARLRG